MLAESAREKHLSFHTPGHKVGKWDITELAYSDNLSSPRGCIAEAEQEIAAILGAYKSFILTDGSTAGVLSMLYAAKSLGARAVAVFASSHKSVFNGCKLLGLTPLVYTGTGESAQNPPTASELKSNFAPLLERADALFITSPSYYGQVAELKALRKLCDERGKLLLIDGAHGGHLHFDKENYAGAYADMWVDGVHKSLPSLTQGAVVSAREKKYADALLDGVQIFRTTSPSYPIMASVEYAVKYPRNEKLERAVRAYANTCARIEKATDWTKLCVLFGESAFDAEKDLRNKGVYPEFCDGNAVVFYLSPALPMRNFKSLKKELAKLFKKYPYTPQKAVKSVPTPLIFEKNTPTEWVEWSEAEGRICACACGLFPPCTPLLQAGERIGAEKIALLQKASNVYGIADGKIAVVKQDTEE